jgi:hypothetical protein
MTENYYKELEENRELLRDLPIADLYEKNIAKIAFSHPKYFDLIPDCFFEDRECIRTLVKGNWGLYYVPSKFQDDKSIVLLALYSSQKMFLYSDWLFSRSNQNLDYISNRLLDDAQVVWAALQNKYFRNSSNFTKISNRLRRNPNIAAAAVRQNIFNIHYLHESLYDSEDFMINFPISFCSSRLKDSTTFIQKKLNLAMNDFCDKSVVKGVSNLSLRLRSDKNIMLQLIEQDESNMLFVSDKLKMDELFVEQALEKNSKVYNFCPWKFSTDINFVLRILGKKIFFVPTHFLQNENDFIKILKVYPECYKHLSLKMKKKKKIILEVLNIGVDKICLLPNELLNDFHFYKEYYPTLRKLYQENPTAFDFIHSSAMQCFRDKNNFLDHFVYSSLPIKQDNIYPNLNLNEDVLREISSFLF